MSFNKPIAGGANFGNAFDLSSLKNLLQINYPLLVSLLLKKILLKILSLNQKKKLLYSLLGQLEAANLRKYLKY